MPFLDVSDVLLDPMFCEALVVTRRVQGLTNKGRVSTTPTTVNPAPYGVVLPVTESPLERGASEQHLPRRIEIHTPYRLRSASQKADGSEQYQPDLITWAGESWTVVLVDDFSRYGAGFIRAEAVATDPLDPEPT